MKQTNQPKSEMEWEKEMKKRLIEVRNGGFISPILEAIKELLAQSRQQFGEEINLIIDNEIKEWQGHGTMTNIAGGAISALKTLKAKLIK